jgi:hypothetical protein
MLKSQNDSSSGISTQILSPLQGTLAQRKGSVRPLGIQRGRHARLRHSSRRPTGCFTAISETVWTSATGQFVYCSGPLPVGVEFNHRACEIVSTFIYAPLLWKHGRKSGILVASAISVAGLLQQLATHWRVHLTGRGGNGSFALVFLASNT